MTLLGAVDPNIDEGTIILKRWNGACWKRLQASQCVINKKGQYFPLAEADHDTEKCFMETLISSAYAVMITSLLNMEVGQ